MVQIPLDDSPQSQQEGLQPIPGQGLQVQTNAQELGGNIAAAAWQGAEVAQKIHHDAWDQANQANVMAAKNAKMQNTNALFYDPKSGVFTQQQGVNAPQAVDAALSAYDKQTSQVMAGLTNDDQKQAFQAFVDEHRASIQAQAFRHEHEQVTAGHNDIVENQVQLQTAAAVQHANDPAATAQAVQGIKDAIAQRGTWNEAAPETVAMQQRRAVEMAHMGVIKQLVADGNDQQASKYLDTNKEELGANLPGATALVDKANVNGQAQRYVDQHALDENGQVLSRQDWLNLQQHDQFLRQMPAGVRQRADELMSHLQEETQGAQQATQRATYDTLLGRIIDPKNPQGIDAPDVQAQLDQVSPEQRIALMSAARKDVAEPDPVDVYHLKLALSDPATKGAVAQKDLTTLGWDPRSTGFKEAEAMQVEVRKSGASKEAPQLLSRQEQVEQSAQSVGISTQKDVDGNYGAQYLGFQKQLLQQEEGFAADNEGKRPSTSERQSMIDHLLLKQVTPSQREWYNPATWGDGEKDTFAFEDPKTQAQAHTALQVPDAPRAAYTKEFTDTGVQPSSGQIADLYNAEQAGVRPDPEITPQHLDNITKVLRNRADPAYQATVAMVKRWSTGMAQEGYMEPRLIQAARKVFEATGYTPPESK